LIPLFVSFKLQGYILAERLGGAIVVDLNRVVDDQIAGDHRIDPLWLASHRRHRVAHRREVDDARNAGKVLEDHAGRHERDFGGASWPAGPLADLKNVLDRNETSTGVSEGVLEQDPDRKGNSVDLEVPLAGKLGQAVHDCPLATEVDGSASSEGIGLRGGHQEIRRVRSRGRGQRKIVGEASTGAKTRVPVAITRRDDRVVFDWDGHGDQTAITARDLRLACPCAQCVDEMSGRPLLDPALVPPDIRPVHLTLVGSYGLRVHWSDGHATGIYTFDWLESRTRRPVP
jgi:DUF971 family protein